ncbi:MAG: D-2-hydroxyacid dehydrogenase [Patescibacteria group bacterium]|nr:D-2-hydroxyacid dehydrogenase [Patescibacteria group bacterium]
MAKNTVILITRDQEAFRKKLLEMKLPEMDILAPHTPEEIREQAGSANIMLANPPLAKDYINDAKGVVWMQSTYAGVDAMNAEGLRKDYTLTNVRDVFGPAMAEYAFAYILAFKKEVLENLSYQQHSEWKQRKLGLLGDETLCIVGAGSIGKEIARIAKAFGMRTIGYRSKDEPVEHFDEIFSGKDLHKCLAQGDYVVSVLPSTKHTDNLFDKAAFGAMKPTALFMNIGRGNAVVEEDLSVAVKEGKIAKAVLDVFREEPLPAGSPLWSADNVYVTPHMSGYVFTEREFEIFAENYRRFRAGEPLMYQVDFDKGY